MSDQSVFQKAWDRADLLGRAYQAWLAITAVCTLSIAFGYRFAELYPDGSTIAVYVAIATGGVLVGLAPILLIGRNRPSPRLNPNLFVESARNDIVVRRKGVRIVETKRIRALRPEGHINLRVAVTGTPQVQLALRSHGRLRGPVPVGAWSIYQVELPALLAKGGEYNLEVEYTTVDPDCTMRPFLGEAVTNWAGFRGVTNMIAFPDETPFDVQRYNEDMQLGGVRAGSIQPVFLDADNSASWQEGEIEPGFSYAVSWRWSPP